MRRISRLIVKNASVLVASATLLAACDFLEVADPGRYTDEALNTPIALEAVANGVENDVMTLVDDMALAQALLSDEYMHSGTWTEWEAIDNGEGRPGNSSDYGVQLTMVQRRTAAQRAQERFRTVLGDSANRTEIMARVIATEAWSNLLLGMHNCESPPGPGEAPVSDVEMYRRSIPIFTRAIEIARAAQSPAYEQMALAGRARANLLAGNLDAAAADARTLPDNFSYTAKFSDTPGPQNAIVTLTHPSRLKAGGLDQVHWGKIDTIAGFARDPWTNQLDRRLKVSHPAGARGADGTTPHFAEEKFTNVTDDILLTHGWEMRLIEAEVALRQNNLTLALQLINRVRANATLNAVSATTAAEVQRYLLWERFSQLFLEGHRANDLARFNLARDLGSNRATKFPLNTTELNLNSHTSGNTSGRCPSLT
ncbi:MAG: RagB/SusD family nutrient uptake outer membrane protein [Longimicrobiales bacterium]